MLRVWYLFSKNRFARWFVVVVFAASGVVTYSYLGMSFGLIHSVTIPIPGLRIMGCTVPPPHRFWRFFLPSLVLHVVLFISTTVHAISYKEILNSSPLMKRLLREYVGQVSNHFPTDSNLPVVACFTELYLV